MLAFDRYSISSIIPFFFDWFLYVLYTIQYKKPNTHTQAHIIHSFYMYLCIFKMMIETENIIFRQQKITFLRFKIYLLIYILSPISYLLYWMLNWFCALRILWINFQLQSIVYYRLLLHLNFKLKIVLWMLSSSICLFSQQILNIDNFPHTLAVALFHSFP